MYINTLKYKHKICEYGVRSIVIQNHYSCTKCFTIAHHVNTLCNDDDYAPLKKFKNNLCTVIKRHSIKGQYKQVYLRFNRIKAKHHFITANVS